jgi:hypothetical protein
MAGKLAPLLLLIWSSSISTEPIHNLQQWLSELQVQLPPFSLLNSTINVTRFDCQDLRFRHLHGNFTNHTYQLAFNDFQADCTLHLDTAPILNQTVHANAIGLLSAATTSFQIAIRTTRSNLPDVAVLLNPLLNFSVCLAE